MGFQALGLGFGDCEWEKIVHNGNGKDVLYSQQII